MTANTARNGEAQQSKSPLAPLPKHARVRLPGLKGVATQHLWIPAKIAQGILQVNNAQVTKLKRNGEIRYDENQGGYNLADVLERYTRKLRTEGAIDNQVETICYREFDSGLIPKDVIIKHGFAFDDVKRAWQHYLELSRDSEAARVLIARDSAQKKEVASKCRTCVRAPELAAADALRIVRDVTEDPERTSLNMAEERACADLDIRCPTCRVIKATAPVDTMRGRIRHLRVMGSQQPVQLEPLPTPAVLKEPA